MNNSPHEHVPHCSPAEPMRSVVTPESRSASSSGVSPNSGLGGRPPSQQILAAAAAAQQQQQQSQLAGGAPVPSPQLLANTQVVVASSPQIPTTSSRVVTVSHMPPSQVLPPPPSQVLPPFSHPPPPSTNIPPPNGTTNAMFRVQMWASNFDSGVQSMNHSAAPSLMSMSSLRAGSQMSTMSEEGRGRIELNDQQQMKFENIPTNIGRGSQDGETRNAIPELIHLLSDTDEVVVQQAATMVQNIAKMDSEQPPYAEPLIKCTAEVIPRLKELLCTRSNSPAIIKPTLGALFQISERREGLESLLAVNEQTNGALLTDIIQHIKLTGGSAIRYAILTFHTIIADKGSDGRNVERARAAGALHAVTQFLDRETNEKLLSVLIECVRLLCDKNQPQKAIFMQLNGPAKLFHILRNLRYEGLLWRTTQLLKTFSNANPQAIIMCGGYDVLPRQLDHPSQRLITSTLECIRNMSDVPTKDLDVSMLLSRLLQLLGANDAVVVLYCTGILSNLLANNQRNKEYVFNLGGIPTLYRVLIESYKIPAATPSQQQRVEDIQERALASLRHLCVGHPHQTEAQKAVLQVEFASEILLRKLTEMRPSILKQTLQILNKAAQQDVNVGALRDTRLREPEATFAERILLILKVACEQLPSTQMVEEVKVAELIQLSLSTLQLLCKGDLQSLSEVVFLVRKPEYLLYREGDGAVLLPVFCLYQGYVEEENLNENLKRSALGLIAVLAQHPEMASVFAADAHLMTAFQHYSRSRNQAFATYAEQAYERSMHGGNSSGAFSGGAPMTSPSMRPMNPPIGVHGYPPYGAPYGPSPPQYPVMCGGPPNDYEGQQMVYPQHGAPLPPPPLPYPCSQEGPSQTQLQGSGHPPAPVMYGREGPSQHCGNSQCSMECSTEAWPEDLSGLSLHDDPYDPFANMFCSQQFDCPPQRSSQQMRPVYSAGARGHETTSRSMYCSPGPPGMVYDQPMEHVHMGSPEAPASWHDPNHYSSYQM